MNKIILGVLLILATGCTQHQLHWYTYKSGGGEIKTSIAPSFPSYCFDGLMKKWVGAGCTTMGYKNISEGFIQFWCADWQNESVTATHPLRANDYWLILWSEAAHQYARPAPDGTTYECGDATALLISAERD